MASRKEPEVDSDEELGAGEWNLGFVEPPRKATDVLRHRFPSKVGGRPAWLDPLHLPTADQLTCKATGRAMQFLLQVRRPRWGRPGTGMWRMRAAGGWARAAGGWAASAVRRQAARVSSAHTKATTRLAAGPAQVYAPVDDNPDAFHRTLFVFTSPQVGRPAGCSKRGEAISCSEQVEAAHCTVCQLRARTYTTPAVAGTGQGRRESCQELRRGRAYCSLPACCRVISWRSGVRCAPSAARCRARTPFTRQSRPRRGTCGRRRCQRARRQQRWRTTPGGWRSTSSSEGAAERRAAAAEAAAAQVRVCGEMKALPVHCHGIAAPPLCNHKTAVMRRVLRRGAGGGSRGGGRAAAAAGAVPGAGAASGARGGGPGGPGGPRGLRALGFILCHCQPCANGSGGSPPICSGCAQAGSGQLGQQLGPGWLAACCSPSHAPAACCRSGCEARTAPR